MLCELNLFLRISKMIRFDRTDGFILYVNLHNLNFSSCIKLPPFYNFAVHWFSSNSFLKFIRKCDVAQFWTSKYIEKKQSRSLIFFKSTLHNDADEENKSKGHTNNLLTIKKHSESAQKSNVIKISQKHLKEVWNN